MPIWLWWLQQFQGMIIGLVGFAGVIMTLAMNDLIARRQHAATVMHDRQSLRTALIEELQVLRSMYDGNARTCHKTQEAHPNPPPRAAFDVPMYDMTDIYDRSTARLGLLTSSELGMVMRAYMMHRQVRHRIVNLLADPQTVTPSSVKVPATRTGLLKAICESLLPELDATIRLLTSCAAAEPDKATA
ncbi:MAG TPA: hypothetical protein VG328_02335 [Stellaceae bacterium]|nr:hypothetical protein [Stellaceae bacterium]